MKNIQTDSKLLASLKCIAQNNKSANEPKSHNKQKEKFSLSSFSAHEYRAKSKERNDHDEISGRELRKFRTEVETKYRASKTNKTYKFPRTCNHERNEEQSKTFNCKFV
jgi:hypothetical protein